MPVITEMLDKWLKVQFAGLTFSLELTHNNGGSFKVLEKMFKFLGNFIQ